MKDQIIEHAKSAALTFVSVAGFQITVAIHGVDDWSGLSWAPLVSAATFAGVRAALKLLISSPALLSLRANK